MAGRLCGLQRSKHARMSGLNRNPIVAEASSGGQSLAKNGHSDAIPTAWILRSVIASLLRDRPDPRSCSGTRTIPTPEVARRDPADRAAPGDLRADQGRDPSPSPHRAAATSIPDPRSPWRAAAPGRWSACHLNDGASEQPRLMPGMFVRMARRLQKSSTCSSMDPAMPIELLRNDPACLINERLCGRKHRPYPQRAIAGCREDP